MKLFDEFFLLLRTNFPDDYWWDDRTLEAVAQIERFTPEDWQSLIGRWMELDNVSAYRLADILGSPSIDLNHARLLAVEMTTSSNQDVANAAALSIIEMDKGQKDEENARCQAM